MKLGHTTIFHGSENSTLVQQKVKKDLVTGTFLNAQGSGRMHNTRQTFGTANPPLERFTVPKV